MDVIAILHNTAEAIDMVINVKEAAKQLQYWRDERKRKDFLASWRAGHLQLAQQRQAITQLLGEYYASSDNGTTQGLWYSFQHADPLPLPLVTINNLLLNTRSSLQLTAEFISGKCPTPALIAVFTWRHPIKKFRRFLSLILRCINLPKFVK